MSIVYPQVFIQKNCPICQSVDVKPVKSELNKFKPDVHEDVYIFTDTWVQLLRCNKCSFAFCKEIPSSQNFFSKRYDIRFDPKAEVENNFKDKINQDVINTVSKTYNKKGKFLDIGSFAGNLLVQAKKKGFDCYGVEANVTMAKYTKENLGLNIFCGEVANIEFNNLKFDVITLIDVLEHLFEPKKIMQRCSEILEKDGIVYIKVPNYLPQRIKQDIANAIGISNLGIFTTFGHINQFSPKSLFRLAEECGLKPIEHFTARSETIPGAGLKLGIKNFFRDLVYSASETFRKITGINIGLNIIVVFKKI